MPDDLRSRVLDAIDAAFQTRTLDVSVDFEREADAVMAVIEAARREAFRAGYSAASQTVTSLRYSALHMGHIERSQHYKDAQEVLWGDKDDALKHWKSSRSAASGEGQ